MTDRRIEAQGSIDRSIVISGDNNRASLVFGDAFTLPLERRQCPPPARRQQNRDALPDLLALLAPDADKIPLVGREAALRDLQAWLDDEVDVSVKALIARAGSGKTRLAVELCKQIDGGREPGQSGWVAGFIRPSDFAAVADKLAMTHYVWPQPTLLVIDYAAAVHRPLADWLDRLASEEFDGKLRLLLLEREAPSDFGWWHDLSRPSGGHAATRRDLLADPDRPSILPDLDPGKDRYDLLIATQAAAQKMIGSAANSASFAPFGSDPRFDEALAAPRFGNPLNLAMAGIIAAQEGPTSAFSQRRLDATRHLARPEWGPRSTGEAAALPGWYEQKDEYFSDVEKFPLPIKIPVSVKNIPSILDYSWTSSGTIAVSASAGSTPRFPLLSSARNHSMRLEACELLARELLNEMKNQKHNVRDDYNIELKRYIDRLPDLKVQRNMLLADATMRTLRALFSAEAAILPAGFAARLKTLMEQHIGLRPFYPEIEEFYQDVRSGKLQSPLPLDAVEKFIGGVIEATPETFDPSVMAGIDEAALEPPTVDVREMPPVDPGQPTPPADPLGELDPETSRNFQIAGAINKLWEVFSRGETAEKSISSWLKVYSNLSTHVQPIIKWLAQLWPGPQ